MQLENEVWVDIVGFPRYQISSQGRVRFIRNNEWYPLYVDQSGRKRHKYNACRLRKDGKRYKFVIHRLMWTCFNGPIPEGYQIDHIDRDKKNNNLNNLRCVTKSENMLNREFVDAQDPLNYVI